MQLFVIGPPRSGTTIVTQFLNHHGDIKIFDEIDLIQVGEFGEMVVGKLLAFLEDRNAYETYRRCARETADPALALQEVMGALARPHTVWGEKNPMYATRLDVLKRSFPKAVILFVLRDPRAVVSSCLTHRDSPARSRNDFWIKNTVAEALALVEACIAPLRSDEDRVAVLRYEAFVARPKATLDEVLGPWGLSFSDSAVPVAHAAPETVGDHQFYRGGAPLPWKVGNLSPLRQAPPSRDRFDADDPAWARVDALALELGYA